MNRKLNIIGLISLLVFFALSSMGGEIAWGQLGRFTKVRVWTDKTGEFKTKTKIETVDNDSLVLELEDKSKKKLRHDVLSQSDLEFLDDYRAALLKQADSKAKDIIRNRETLNHYQAFLKTNFVSVEDQKLINEKIGQLEFEIFSGKTIVLPSGAVTEKELLAKKMEASEMITHWIEDVKTREAESADMLRDAIKRDPTSLEASILLSIYYEVNQYKHQTAQRHLVDAVRRGKKFLPIASESDKKKPRCRNQQLGNVLRSKQPGFQGD